MHLEFFIEKLEFVSKIWRRDAAHCAGGALIEIMQNTYPQGKGEIDNQESKRPLCVEKKTRRDHLWAHYKRAEEEDRENRELENTATSLDSKHRHTNSKAPLCTGNR